MYRKLYVKVSCDDSSNYCRTRLLTPESNLIATFVGDEIYSNVSLDCILDIAANFDDTELQIIAELGRKQRVIYDSNQALPTVKSLGALLDLHFKSRSFENRAKILQKTGS